MTRSIVRTNRNRAFTLVEILIVVVILGILAAIVIPQFTNASQEASANSSQSQLQTIRAQIELYRMKNQGDLPVTSSLLDWDLLTADQGDGNIYLQADPLNPLTGESSVVAVGGTYTDEGWAWNNTAGTIHAINKDEDAIMPW